MSKAFVSEDAAVPDDAERLPERSGSEPITPAGLRRLRDEHNALEASKADARRLRVLQQILDTIHVVEPKLEDGRVSFGARVELETEDGDRLGYELVGPDEADVKRRRISIQSPVARALIGKRIGDTAVIRRPKGEIEVTIAGVSLPDEPA